MNIFRRLSSLRSAITGRFVSAEYAEEHPETTVRENAARLADRIRREGGM